MATRVRKTSGKEKRKFKIGTLITPKENMLIKGLVFKPGALGRIAEIGEIEHHFSPPSSVVTIEFNVGPNVVAVTYCRDFELEIRFNIISA